MPTPNPRYNPDWKKFFKHHSTEWKRIGEERDALNERDRALDKAGQRYDSPERTAIFEENEKLRLEQDKHHEACLDSFKMQHPTIQEYAAWVFSTFGLDTFGFENEAEGVDVPAVNFEKLTTFEDVSEAWSRANEAVSERGRRKHAAESDPKPRKPNPKP